MKRILTVIGARPQFIKAATISRLIAESDALTETLVHTGQHFDDNMSKVFFDELKIPAPDYNLAISGGTHGHMTGAMLAALEDVMLETKPDAVAVYGDTNSTLAGALAAVKLGIPIAHIEAGLRSFNMDMPEEINRILTDRISSLLFCPTQQAVEHLRNEGTQNRIEHVGDVMYDATLFARQASAHASSILEDLGLEPGRFGLCTLHRAENTNDPERFRKLCTFLEEQAAHTPLVFPVHPRTRKLIDEQNIRLSNIRMIDPVGYLDMHRLIDGATTVLTDSGGLQKEAYFHRTPCITLRDETEWVETITSGWNRLWTSPEKDIVRVDISDYGNGDAGAKIVQSLRTFFAS